MMRWIVFHLPDLACTMIASRMGFPAALAGRVRFSKPTRWSRGKPAAHHGARNQSVQQASGGPRTKGIRGPLISDDQ